MAHKPSPVQVSFLGFPTSTGAQYIDYYMADPSALPAEGRDAFVEKIAYMPSSCIANDYAQLRGGVLDLTGSNRLDRSFLRVSFLLLMVLVLLLIIFLSHVKILAKLVFYLLHYLIFKKLHHLFFMYG